MRDSLQAIQQAGDRAAALTRKLLVFSRQDPVDKKVLDLNHVVSDTEKMLRRLIGEDIQFTVHLDPTIGLVKCDPSQLDQLLINLVINARDAMPGGGKLVVETRAAERECTTGESAVAARNTSAVLSVTDTGIGMSPELIGRIFEPFFTTKPAGQGSGLGLSVVHGIVEQTGGRIEVSSQPGAGTTFRIHFPVTLSQLSVPDEQPVVSGLSGAETILLVEDEEAIRQFTSDTLRSHGYRVLQAANGQEALEITAAHADEIKLLVTDVVMPHMGGMDLAKVLRVRFPAIKILFVSGYSGDAIARRGPVPPDVDLLLKPFTSDDLLRKIRQALDSRPIPSISA